MTDKPRDLRYQVSADRSSATRKVRYVETNQGDADDCMLCQLDEGGGVPAGECDETTAAVVQPDVVVESPVAELEELDEKAEDELVESQLLEAIENQLAAQQPPFVQPVFNKLTLVGHTREEIVQLMAQVLAWQISDMLEADHAFDMVAYERALRALPQLPDAP
ncbi:MAG TPA: hypothetical protein VJY83_01315 [Thiopseudomonas sp.]|nr:hypothetical protein [Thiopseudomonas sp.]